MKTTIPSCGRSAALLMALSGLSAVALGAYGAHGIAAASPELLQTWQTGVRYHMFHTIGLLACALLKPSGAPALIKLAELGFVLGIVLFSGSLYLLVLAPKPWLGFSAAAGGSVFMLAWGVLFVGILMGYGSKQQPGED